MKTTRRQFMALIGALAVIRVVPVSAPQLYPDCMEAGEPGAQCGPLSAAGAGGREVVQDPSDHDDGARPYRAPLPKP
jgi:hypothetical protein